ncbi:serpentine type 7TM GPCR chemoreceptor srd domain-containing protein [Ditylenchus destructor]|uniref:Serpentine type 7TM GPCR chemoreceptor srd domain-containing protein n=1 Tax=Ditylenchus destructor TaxID=166010 RepID=A0AAD4MTB3_9BILA|nr:serpentine type 7TM GPCR chemoreceptor srd domain-containing protein [Ditylenchus destructor]
MALEIDQAHHITETVQHSFALFFNIVLLYLIKSYSTFGVKLYKYLLTIDALLDLSLAALALGGDGYLILTLNGFFAGHSPALDSLLYTMFLFIMHTNILWIPVQFIYRYRLLCKDDSQSIRINVLIVVATAAYSLLALFIIAWVCEYREELQPFGQNVFRLNKWPQHKNGRHQFVFGCLVTEIRGIPYMILWAITATASIFIVVWCERKIARHFRQLGRPTHDTTQKMHKEFHRALLAMAICPLITATIPVYYFIFCFIFQLSIGWLSAMVTSMLSLITVFNPLTTVICFRCYRQNAIRLLTCGTLCRNVVKPTSSLEMTPASLELSLPSEPQQASGGSLNQHDGAEVDQNTIRPMALE